MEAPRDYMPLLRIHKPHPHHCADKTGTAPNRANEFLAICLRQVRGKTDKEKLVQLRERQLRPIDETENDEEGGTISGQIERVCGTNEIS